MLKIGCHLSSSKGYLAMGETAKSIGANTFQFFTRNPRGGSAKPFDALDAAAYCAFAAEQGIGPIIAHAPYTLNACAADEGLRLDMAGICASSGSACTSGSLDPSHVLLSLGLPHEIAHGSLRLSLGEYNTMEEVDYVVESLKQIVERLRMMSPLYDDFINGVEQ